jgi:hypothetical protein
MAATNLEPNGAFTLGSCCALPAADIVEDSVISNPHTEGIPRELMSREIESTGAQRATVTRVPPSWSSDGRVSGALG